MRTTFRTFQSLLTIFLLIALVPLALDAQQGRGRGRARGPLGPVSEPVPFNEERHDDFVEIARAGNIDLLFSGDSITDWWRRDGEFGQTVWAEHFAPLNAANFGIAGNNTQGVLWGMRNGELEGYEAKLIVHMLGTNNINRNTNADIVEGNRLILEEFKKQQPQAKVLLLGVFPRGEEPDNPFRASIREINDGLAQLADNQQVFFMDIGPAFLEADGTLSTEVMPDGLHPNTHGYQIWADAIIDRVHELME
jgi:lysophospholipase L1-like esterase